MSQRPLAAIGFTVKSGWASAVLVAAPVATPRIVDSRRIELSDPALPEARQPYHDGFGTARSRGPELSKLLASVRRFGARSVKTTIDRYTVEYRVHAAGIVVGSLIDPEQIGNSHIRIHALEGQLFRTIVENAALDRLRSASVWRERDLLVSAHEKLDQSEQAIRARLAALGKSVKGAWRVEQKSSTLAAWLALAGCVEATRA